MFPGQPGSPKDPDNSEKYIKRLKEIGGAMVIELFNDAQITKNSNEKILNHFVDFISSVFKEIIKPENYDNIDALEKLPGILAGEYNKVNSSLKAEPAGLGFGPTCDLVFVNLIKNLEDIIVERVKYIYKLSDRVKEGESEKFGVFDPVTVGDFHELNTQVKRISSKIDQSNTLDAISKYMYKRAINAFFSSLWRKKVDIREEYEKMMKILVEVLSVKEVYEDKKAAIDELRMLLDNFIARLINREVADKNLN